MLVAFFQIIMYYTYSDVVQCSDSHLENAGATIGWPEAAYEAAYFIKLRIPATKPRQNEAPKERLRITMLRVRPLQNLQSYHIQMQTFRRAYTTT
jgi:hypothetical protein